MRACGDRTVSARPANTAAGNWTIYTNAAIAGIDSDHESSDTLHDRSIVVDTGWTTVLGRGVDVFQLFDANWLDLRLHQQRCRAVRKSTLTHVRTSQEVNELLGRQSLLRPLLGR